MNMILKYNKAFTFLFLLVYQTMLIGQTQTTVAPISQAEIDTAKQLTSDFLRSEKIPGLSISISQNGSLVWSEGFGYSNIAEKKEVSPSVTQFRIASISKSVTALGLAKLMDDGLMDLDASIYTYIPDFPKKKYDFTVRQVGGHIAGIRHYNGSEFILNKKMSIVEGLDIFKDSPLKSEPGTAYSYSTYGWNLLSVVIQNASKTEFNQFMKAEVFTPLKMDNTTLDLSDTNMPNRTLFYNKTNAGDIVLGPAVSNEHKVAGGGFIATSEDLVRFGNEIIDPKVFSKSSINELVTSQKTTDGELTNYGVGFRVAKTANGTPKYSHSGGGIGATTFILILPEEGIVLALVTNLSGVPYRKLINQLETILIN